MTEGWIAPLTHHEREVNLLNRLDDAVARAEAAEAKVAAVEAMDLTGAAGALIAAGWVSPDRLDAAVARAEAAETQLAHLRGYLDVSVTYRPQEGGLGDKDRLAGCVDAIEEVHYRFRMFSTATETLSRARQLVELDNAVSDLQTWHPSFDIDTGTLGWEREDDD